MDRDNSIVVNFPRDLSLVRRILLYSSRVRRWFLGLFRPGYVRKSLARRRGECRRCGACCQIGVRCDHLCADGPFASCDRYGAVRTFNCRAFPIDERDLADRDHIAPDQPCGFYFEDRDN